MDDFDMAEALSAAIQAYDGDGREYAATLASENAAFSEFTVTVDGERFLVTVRDLG